MSDIENSSEKHDTQVSRREVFGLSTAALAATLALAGAKKASAQTRAAANHNAPNETDPGAQNLPLAAENPDSEWSPPTDSGTVKPFKYSFALGRKRVESGGWTRQVTARELPVSTTMAGVEMRLTAGGVRELHWHVEAEWAIMLNGNARITAVDQEGKSFVGDVGQGDLWLFPPGSASFDPGPGPGRLQIPACVRRWEL
jgi:oxalate decarboxylase